MTGTLRGLMLATTLLTGGAAFAEDVTLNIESWRNDDLTIWQETILPAFEAAHPDIDVQYETAAFGDYFTKLQTVIAAGQAPDAFELNYENNILFQRFL